MKKAIIRFVKREPGITFNEHPNRVLYQLNHFYDNINDLNYEIANSLVNGADVHRSFVVKETTGVVESGDLTYYVWGKFKHEPYISIFNRDKCSYVGTASQMLSKYKLNTKVVG